MEQVSCLCCNRVKLSSCKLLQESCEIFTLHTSPPHVLLPPISPPPVVPLLLTSSPSPPPASPPVSTPSPSLIVPAADTVRTNSFTLFHTGRGPGTVTLDVLPEDTIGDVKRRAVLKAMALADKTQHISALHKQGVLDIKGIRDSDGKIPTKSPLLRIGGVDRFIRPRSSPGRQIQNILEQHCYRCGR